MGLDLGEKDNFFEFPESSIKGIPLVSPSGKTLDIGFIEVGCKPRKKVGALKNKKELFYKYWGDLYRDKLGVNWLPGVYRSLAHYEPGNDVDLEHGRVYGLDAVLFYEYISEEMLRGLKKKHKRRIYNITKNHKNYPELKHIIKTFDAEGLHQLIVGKSQDPSYAMIRGVMAEILALKDFEKVLSEGMSLYRNGDIRYFNKRYDNGTEIDGILTFYGEEKYIETIEKLKKLDHLKVKAKWD